MGVKAKRALAHLAQRELTRADAQWKPSLVQYYSMSCEKPPNKTIYELCKSNFALLQISSDI